jgi:effector-binding domain-containing protein
LLAAQIHAAVGAAPLPNRSVSASGARSASGGSERLQQPASSTSELGELSDDLFLVAAAPRATQIHADTLDRVPAITYLSVALRNGLVLYNCTMTTSEITVSEIEAQDSLSITVQTTADKIGESFGEVMTRLGAYREASGALMTGPPFARYHTWGESVTMEVGFPVGDDTPGEGEVERGALPSGSIARAVHTGPYPTLRGAYSAFEEWMKASGRQPSGAPWEVYLTDPSTPGLDPEDYKTEIFWPIA